MVYNPDDEWVSEQGTERITSIAQEPHSINETSEKQRKTAPQRETRKTAQAGDEVPNAQAEEPTQSADQRDAAMGSLSGRVESAVPVGGQTLIYAATAVVGLLIVQKVM